MRIFLLCVRMMLVALTLVACSGEGKKDNTGVVVSLTTNLTRSEFEAVVLRVYRPDDVRMTQPIGDDVMLTAGAISTPVLIKRNQDDRILLVVQMLALGSRKPIIEQRVQAQFQDGHKLPLRVYMARACKGVACGVGETCYPTVDGCKGECGPIHEPAVLDAVRAKGQLSPRDPSPSEAKCPPSVDGGPPDRSILTDAAVDASDAGPVETGAGPVDGALLDGEAGPADAQLSVEAGPVCVPTLPDAGAACNLATQCGCSGKASCVVSAVNGIIPVLACETVAEPIVLPSQPCSATRHCPGGHDCVGNPAVCRPFCASDKDCGSGRCLNEVNAMSQSITGVKVCLPSCTSDSDCLSGNFCAAGLCAPLIADGNACDMSEHCKGFESGASACLTTKTQGKRCEPFGCKVNSDCAGLGSCCKMLSNGKHACYPADECTAPAGCAAGLLPPFTACTARSQCCGFTAGTHDCIGNEATGAVCQRLCSSRPIDNNCWSDNHCCAPYSASDAGVDGGFCAPDDHCR